jgi:hypothetical protein
MSTHIYKKLGSLELIRSLMTLCSYEVHPFQLQVNLQNISIELAGKTILIDIELVDSELNYHTLLGCSYMYAMKAIASATFCLMMFPDQGKVVMLDQITYHDPKSTYNPDNMFSSLKGSISLLKMV